MSTLNWGIHFNPKTNVVTKILDCILYNNLHILNDASANQTSQITGNDSTPDISVCGSNWSKKTSWRLADPIDNSYHLPIFIKINHKICYEAVNEVKTES